MKLPLAIPTIMRSVPTEATPSWCWRNGAGRLVRRLPALRRHRPLLLPQAGQRRRPQDAHRHPVPAADPEVRPLPEAPARSSAKYHLTAKDGLVHAAPHPRGHEARSAGRSAGRGPSSVTRPGVSIIPSRLALTRLPLPLRPTATGCTSRDLASDRPAIPARG